jgi:hypothetical protein
VSSAGDDGCQQHDQYDSRRDDDLAGKAGANGQVSTDDRNDQGHRGGGGHAARNAHAFQLGAKRIQVFIESGRRIHWINLHLL